MTLFIVDDSSELRTRLRRILTALPRTRVLGEAGDGAEALRRIRSCHPDLVLLDLEMPGVNGMSIIPALKKMDHAPVIVVLTNRWEPQFRERCRKLGADYFFDKSIDFEKAVDVVDQLTKLEDKERHQHQRRMW